MISIKNNTPLIYKGREHIQHVMYRMTMYAYANVSMMVITRISKLPLFLKPLTHTFNKIVYQLTMPSWFISVYRPSCKLLFLYASFILSIFFLCKHKMCMWKHHAPDRVTPRSQGQSKSHLVNIHVHRKCLTKDISIPKMSIALSSITLHSQGYNRRTDGQIIRPKTIFPWQFDPGAYKIRK